MLHVLWGKIKMNKYCCKGFEEMIKHHHFLTEKEKFHDSLQTYFDPTNFQIQVSVDHDESGWIYIKYCPLCGKKLI